MKTLNNIPCLGGALNALMNQREYKLRMGKMTDFILGIRSLVKIAGTLVK